MHLAVFLYQFDFNGLSTDLRSKTNPTIMQLVQSAWSIPKCHAEVLQIMDKII